MRRFCFLLFLLVLIPFAQAEKWTAITKQDDVYYFVDEESIEHHGALTFVWYTSRPKKPKERIEKQVIHWTQGKMQIHCKERTHAVIELHHFNKKNKVIQGGPLPVNLVVMKEVVPDSPAEKILTFVCKEH